MRKIEFRAWDKEKEKMLTGINQYGPDEPDFVRESSTAGAFTRLWEALARFKESNRFVLMQHTGLKDKNGKGIFEGDILSLMDDDSILAVVEWNTETAAFCAKGQNEQSDHLYAASYAKKIGNIHESPELLK